MSEKLMSLNPSDAIHYAFLDNTDGRIVDAYTTVFQDDKYNDGEPVVGFNIVVDTEDGHDPVNKFLKMGSTQAIAPNEDQTGFKAVGQNIKGFSDKCAGMYFLTSLANAQYPASALEDEVNIKKMLIGLKAHFETEEVPIGKTGKASYTIVTKIYELPDHIAGSSASKGKKSKPSTSSKSSPTTSQATPSKEDLDDYAATWIMAKVTGDDFSERFPDGYIDKNRLAPLLMQDAEYDSDSSMRQKAAMRVFKEELLKKNIGWKFNASENRVYPAE